MIQTRVNSPTTALIEDAPSGLVGTLGVRISDAVQQTDVLARTTSGIVEYPAGSGVYAVTFNAPAQPGSFMVLWDTGGADPTYATEELKVTIEGGDGYVPTMGPGYPTVEDFLANSRIAALTSLTPEQAEPLRQSAIMAVEEFCGQRFTYEPNTVRTVDGTGQDAIYLPKRLERLISLTVPGSGLEVGDLMSTENFDQLIVKPLMGAEWNYYTQALWDLDGRPPLRFSAGEENITIRGDWGWSSFPMAVFRAILKDMEDTALADSMALNDTIRAYRKLGLADISQGDLRASLTGMPGLSDEVIALLRPFVWEGRVGVVV